MSLCDEMKVTDKWMFSEGWLQNFKKNPAIERRYPDGILI
jgi:hypothetical protein